MSDKDNDPFPKIAYTGHPYISDSGNSASLVEQWRDTWTLVVHGTPPRLAKVDFIDVLVAGWRHSPERCEGSRCMAELHGSDSEASKIPVGTPGGRCATQDCCNQAVAVLPLEAADSQSRSWREMPSRCLDCVAHFHRIATPIYREPNDASSAHVRFGQQLQRYLTLPRVMIAAAHCDYCGQELNVANPAITVSGANTTPGTGISIVCHTHITGNSQPE